ncbi:MAG: hypothetical protein KBC95_01780, partial [Candidatus Peribacteraceae bacterium]|nr:hypothetical protein [Candidatus Peribacteraceae bacterium]
LLSALLATAPAAAQQASVYSAARADVLEESARFGIAPEVERFARAVLAAQGVTLTTEQVKRSLTLPASTVCNNRALATIDDSEEESNDEEAKDEDRSECLQTIERLQRLLKRESSVQALGRDLQAIAASAELATDSYPGMGSETLLVTEAIRTIWGNPGSGSRATLSVRAWPEDTDFSGITGALGGLSREERTGAIWRAFYGVRFAQGERGRLNDADTASNPQNALGTERQYLFKEQPAVDAALLALRATLLGDSLNDEAEAEAEPGRIVVLYPPKSIGGNLVVWVSSDDVGLREETPIHPVLPSLGSEGSAIVGGTWPPPPPGPTRAPLSPSRTDDSAGLCLDPIADDGFLCTAPADGTSPCEEETPNAAGAITLAACTPADQETEETIAGPQICSDIDWRGTGFDPNQQCTPELECAPSCADATGQINDETQYHVYMKEDKDGKQAVARACVKEEGDLLPAYRLIQAASGIRVSCESENGVDVGIGLPPEEMGFACCSLTAQMATVMCREMEEDGVFAEEDRTRAVSTTGEVFGAGSCALAFAIDYCGPQCGLQPEGFLEELIERANANPAGRPESCQEAIGQTVVQGLIGEAAVIDEACSPERETDMPNTILANTCYAGSCLERSLKLHNLVPGFGALTAVDQTMPQMPELQRRDEGREVEVAPVREPRLPSYEPSRVVGDFDAAFCQLNGLPPQTPPVVCAVDPLRRVTLTLADPFSQQANLDQQRAELAAQQSAFLRTGLPAGTRIGDRMFTEALRGPVQGLADSVETSTGLLADLAAVQFTPEMCPLSTTQPLVGSGVTESDTGSFLF